MMRPESDVGGVQKAEKSETPMDTIDDNNFSSGAELIDDGSQKEKMNERPSMFGSVSVDEPNVLLKRTRTKSKMPKGQE